MDRNLAVYRRGVGLRGREILRHPGTNGRIQTRSLLQNMLEVFVPRRQHCEFLLF